MTAYLLRQAAILELLKRDPPVQRYRSQLPGLWHRMGGRENTKRHLALAWLAHRMEAHRDSSKVVALWKTAERSPQPVSIDDQLALVLDGLEREWKKMWSEK